MTVAVVGSGPAGMLAAIMLARAGETVRLLDEQAAAGGHLTYSRYSLPGGGTSAGLLIELETGLRKSGVAASEDSVVWAAFQADVGFELSVNRRGSQESVSCDRILFATGTTDRAISVPGGTLPGVMTARAARILGERHGVVAGERFAIVGAGAEAERLARDIAGWGARVEVMADVESVQRIGGQESVQAIETVDGTTEVDVVVIAAGELPDVQLPGMLGIERAFDVELGGWRVPSGKSMAGVRVIGGASLGEAWVGEILRDTVEGVSALTGIDGASLLGDLDITQALLSVSREHQR